MIWLLWLLLSLVTAIGVVFLVWVGSYLVATRYGPENETALIVTLILGCIAGVGVFGLMMLQ